MNSQAGELLPAAIFLFALALASLTGVFVARIRNRWHWGRTADSVPISRCGCSLLSIAFLVMGMAPAARLFGVSDNIAILFLFGGFILFIVAGLLDSWRGASQDRRKR